MKATLTITADVDALGQISAFITEAAELAGLDERATWQVQLAVDEAATNIIQHAYEPDQPGDIVVGWTCEAERFVVTLRDFGREFDPDDVPEPDIASPLEERQVGGLGIYMITRLMDEVRFEFDPQAGNLLTITKYLSGNSQNDICVMPVEGRVDAATSPRLSKQVHDQIDAGARFVLLDMQAVSFLSSSGLRSLLLIRRDLMTLGGELRLAALQPQVYEVFALTGFTQVFAIHDTLDEARESFGQGRA
jgi:serine/threonine-protein kinase RsbW